MDFYDITNFLTYLSPIILFGGVVLGSCYFSKIDILYKIIVYYLFGMLAIDISARVYGEIYGSNLLFIPILGFMELLAFFCFYFYSGILESRKKSVFLGTIFLLSSAFMAWEFTSISNNATLEGFQSYSKVISTFLIVLLAIDFFISKILSSKNIAPQLFFLNSVIIMYFSMVLIIFIPIDFLINDATGVKYYIWFANLLFTLVFYVLLIISIWKIGKARG